MWCGGVPGVGRGWNGGRLISSQWKTLLGRSRNLCSCYLRAVKEQASLAYLVPPRQLGANCSGLLFRRVILYSGQSCGGLLLDSPPASPVSWPPTHVAGLQRRPQAPKESSSPSTQALLPSLAEHCCQPGQLHPQVSAVSFPSFKSGAISSPARIRPRPPGPATHVGLVSPWQLAPGPLL